MCLPIVIIEHLETFTYLPGNGSICVGNAQHTLLAKRSSSELETPLLALCYRWNERGKENERNPTLPQVVFGSKSVLAPFCSLRFVNRQTPRFFFLISFFYAIGSTFYTNNTKHKKKKKTTTVVRSSEHTTIRIQDFVRKWKIKNHHEHLRNSNPGHSNTTQTLQRISHGNITAKERKMNYLNGIRNRLLSSLRALRCSQTYASLLHAFRWSKRTTTSFTVAKAHSANFYTYCGGQNILQSSAPALLRPKRTLRTSASLLYALLLTKRTFTRFAMVNTEPTKNCKPLARFPVVKRHFTKVCKTSTRSAFDKQPSPKLQACYNAFSEALKGF